MTSPSAPAIKVLFLAANPRDKTRLALDIEVREIGDRIRGTRYRDRIQLISEWAVRPRDLQDRLLWHQPHIVHFSGHGHSDRILLMDDHGRAVPVSGQALQRMFGSLKDNIHCVVFNACFSEDQARAVTDNIEAAIGMHKAMGDRDAIAFASAFYMALGHGRSIKNAFDIGVTELVLHNAKYQHVPVLHTREGVDADGIVLLAPMTEQAAAPGPEPVLAAQPARPAQAAVPSPDPVLSRGELEVALSDLFKSMFSPPELYSFLRHALGPAMADDLPSPGGASRALYAATVAEKLVDRGNVKARFIQAWAEARPDRAADIYALMPSAMPPGGLPAAASQASNPPSSNPLPSAASVATVAAHSPSPGSSAAGSDPESAEYLDELTEDEQDQLVQLLCKCRAIIDKERRALVLGRLDDEISGQIPDSPVLDTHVTQIVKTCTAFDGGIEKLRDAVHRHEGGTRAMKKVDRLLADVRRRQERQG